MTEKPVLFLLPGLMCDETVWRDQARVLAPHAEVVIPVFRGFDSLEAMAWHVLSLAPQRFSVAGHSMGGRVAWELMALAGNRIDRFAVLDTGVHGVKPEEPKGRQVLIDKAKATGLQAVADAWIMPMLHPDNRGDEHLVQAINAMILSYSVDEFLGQVKALLDRRDQTPLLSDIRQKVLLVVGEGDTWSPPEQHAFMASRLARSQLEIVPGAGHMVTMEKPGQVSKILLDWYMNDEV